MIERGWQGGTAFFPELATEKLAHISLTRKHSIAHIRTRGKSKRERCRSRPFAL